MGERYRDAYVCKQCHEAPCPDCGGEGWPLDGQPGDTCERCIGTGLMNLPGGATSEQRLFRV